MWTAVHCDTDTDSDTFTATNTDTDTDTYRKTYKHMQIGFIFTLDAVYQLQSNP